MELAAVEVRVLMAMACPRFLSRYRRLSECRWRQTAREALTLVLDRCREV